MEKIKFFFRKLLFSNELNEDLPSGVIKSQFQNIKDIWNNSGNIRSKAIGSERILKIMLVVVQFITPSIYFRAIFGKYGNLTKNIGVEIYVFIKVLIAFFVLYFGWFNHLTFCGDRSFFMYLSMFMILETILYSSNLIINNDVFPKPSSYKRNIIFVLVDYIEINFDFAIIYLSLNTLQKVVDSSYIMVNSPLDAVYFSFITSLTIGYGDITPINEIGKYVVLSHVLVILLLVALIINFYSSKLSE